MARCEVCCWGEVDIRDADGGEVCETCMAAMAGEEVEA